VLLAKYYKHDQIKEDKMDRALNTLGEEYIHSFGGNT
jgi:hypothetical protein